MDPVSKILLIGLLVDFLGVLISCWGLSFGLPREPVILRNSYEHIQAKIRLDEFRQKISVEMVDYGVTTIMVGTTIMLLSPYIPEWLSKIM